MIRRRLAAPVLLLVVFFLAMSASAQIQNWRILKTFHASDSVSFLTVSNEKGNQTIVVMDAKARTKREIPIEGRVVGIGMSKTKILIFFAEVANRDASSRIMAIHVMAVDSEHYGKGPDHICFQNPGKMDLDATVLNDPDGQFNYLMVRITANKNIRYPYGAYGSGEKEQETSQLSVITVRDDGTTASTDLQSAAIGGRYFGSASNGKDLYIVSYNDGRVVVDAFDQSLQALGSLSAPIDLSKKWDYYAFVQADPVAPGAVNMSLRYETTSKDSHNGLYRFDFNTKKVLQAPDVPLTKVFVRGRQAHQVAGSDYASIKEVEALKPVDMIETGDKIILLKEVYYMRTMGANIGIEHEGSVVEVYSKDLQLLHDCALGKDVVAFVGTMPDVGMHLRGDQLLVSSCEAIGRASFQDYLYVIGLSDFSITRKPLLRSGVDNKMYLEATKVIWNDDGFIAPLGFIGTFIRVDGRTSLQKYNYGQVLK